MQVRGWRQRDAPDVLQREVARETDDRVALVVEPAAPGASGHLGVLRAREELATGVGVLRESLEGDRAGGHVHPECQGLGGEDDGEQIAFEAGLDDLAKRGHHPGVVHGDPPAQCVDEVRVLERLKILVGEVDETRFGDALDLATLFGLGEQQTVATQLVDRVVTRRAREDEDDDRQQVLALERLHELRAPWRAKRRRRCARLRIPATWLRVETSERTS